MDGTQFRQALVDAAAEELDDFSSIRLLPTLTDGDVSRDRLLRAMADSEHAARETFRRWADDEEDPNARELFADVERQEDDHRDRVLTVLGDPYDPTDGGPLHTYLRGREDTDQRLAGGLVARPLVSVASYTRLVEYFDGAHTDAAALARDLRTETDEVIDEALALLEARCDADDWERARMAAEYTIQVAHDDLQDALRSVDIE